MQLQSSTCEWTQRERSAGRYRHHSRATDRHCLQLCTVSALVWKQCKQPIQADLIKCPYCATRTVGRLGDHDHGIRLGCTDRLQIHAVTARWRQQSELLRCLVYISEMYI